MTVPSTTPHSKILNLTLTLTNYPILAQKIRIEMRRILFERGIIAPSVFETEVERKASISQQMEGLSERKREPQDIWERRLACIRDYLTDFYFAYNLPHNTFQQVVQNAINENRTSGAHEEVHLSFNPELAPWEMLFPQAEKYSAYPPEKFVQVQHHLRGIIVVLLKGLVSDQLAFIKIARQFIDVHILKEIKARRFGRGKIGGKAAGMTLAKSILLAPQADDPIDFAEHVDTPDTYFIGADVYYDFKNINGFENYTAHKYLTREEIEERFPEVKAAYLRSSLPQNVMDGLRQFLREMGNEPLIVRSSSLLEDNFGSSFAGKYDSYFLPNQGTLDENLDALVEAIGQIYASISSPDALFYRQAQGLVDYDERMAILIQRVQGKRYGRYFMPYVAGVGFSRNPFLWNKKLRAEDGFLRIVCGLGTRAVDRVDNDYPRMIGLSHPHLRPVGNASNIVKYSQRYLDVLDLETNVLTTVPMTDVLSSNFAGIQFIASVFKGDFVKPIFSLGQTIPPEDLVLTFDNLLRNTDFVKIMKAILKKLETHYERPVDIEYTVELTPAYPKPKLKIYLLQCRPMSNREWAKEVEIPKHIAEADQIFTANHLVSHGVVDKIEYIVYVDPETYSEIDNSTRLHIARVIGRLNKRLEGKQFILMGPGRWGSSNIDLGVKVTYADIYNTRMLIEIALARSGSTPEVSYGTHFFQDLVESNIYPLPLYPDQPEIVFRHDYLMKSPNSLGQLLPNLVADEPFVKVIHVPTVSLGKLLRVAMNSEQSQALGYLRRYD